MASYQVGVAVIVLQISIESECLKLRLGPPASLKTLNVPRLLCHLSSLACIASDL